MKNLTDLLLIAIAIFVASCGSQQQKVAELSQSIDTFALLKKGDTISAHVQKVLLSNVMQAIKTGGPEYAITFCNERAMPLTDSLAKANNCMIQRVSDKYRNPANKLTEYDKEMWKQLSSSTAVNPILVAENGQMVFYKPIKIAMAACLTCHGTTGKEINQKTAKAAVTVLNMKDSVLVAYTRTAADGSFKIEGLPQGDYILLVTYPKYGDYVDLFTIEDGVNVDMKKIFLTQKALLLDEIVIRQAAIR